MSPFKHHKNPFLPQIKSNRYLLLMIHTRFYTILFYFYPFTSCGFIVKHSLISKTFSRNKQTHAFLFPTRLTWQYVGFDKWCHYTGNSGFASRRIKRQTAHRGLSITVITIVIYFGTSPNSHHSSRTECQLFNVKIVIISVGHRSPSPKFNGVRYS